MWLKYSTNITGLDVPQKLINLLVFRIMYHIFYIWWDVMQLWGKPLIILCRIVLLLLLWQVGICIKILFIKPKTLCLTALSAAVQIDYRTNHPAVLRGQWKVLTAEQSQTHVSDVSSTELCQKQTSDGSTFWDSSGCTVNMGGICWWTAFKPVIVIREFTKKDKIKYQKHIYYDFRHSSSLLEACINVFNVLSC